MSDVCEPISVLLLDYSLSRSIIDSHFNNRQEDDSYEQCVAEAHLSPSVSSTIRSSVLLLLANLTAEGLPSVIQRILSKKKLFSILRVNFVEGLWDSDMLESAVNLISNIARIDEVYSYNDFCDINVVVEVLLPITIREDKLIHLCSLLEATVKVLDKGDDDDICGFVNDSYEILTTLNAFILQDFWKKKQEEAFIASLVNVAQIFQICCSQYESLTLQVVELGIFDSLGFVALSADPKDPSLTELLISFLATFEVAFNSKSYQIIDKFVLDDSFNSYQCLTARILDIIESSDYPSLSLAAVSCITSLIDALQQPHLSRVYSEKLMRTLVNVLKENSANETVKLQLLRAVSQLVYLGNQEQPVDNSPQIRDFLKYQGDAILDSIQKTLSDEAFSESEILMARITSGDNEGDANEEENSANDQDLEE